jgi:hypothetical protein
MSCNDELGEAIGQSRKMLPTKPYSSYPGARLLRMTVSITDIYRGDLTRVTMSHK